MLKENEIGEWAWAGALLTDSVQRAREPARNQRVPDKRQNGRNDQRRQVGLGQHAHQKHAELPHFDHDPAENGLPEQPGRLPGGDFPGGKLDFRRRNYRVGDRMLRSADQNPSHSKHPVQDICVFVDDHRGQVSAQ